MTELRARTIIINADDFGMDMAVNDAIVEAFARDLISSTSIMVNMPGFADAVKLAHGLGLQDRIGVHLNITQGRPATAWIARCRGLCDEAGEFRARRTMFHLTREEMCAVEEELEAQVGACIDAGIRPTHLDSHHHVHTEWAVGQLVINVARRVGIKAVRLTRNCGVGINATRAAYKCAYNLRLRIYGLAKTRYFGSARDVQTVLRNTHAAIEVMVHPRWSDSGGLVDLDGVELAPRIEAINIPHVATGYGVHKASIAIRRDEQCSPPRS